VGGWGTAEVGGTWTIPAEAARFSVANRAGTVKLNAGDGYAARLDQVASTGSDVRIAMSVDQPPGGPGYFVNVIGRKVGSHGDYRAKFGIAANGTVAVWLVKTVGTTETVIGSASTGLKYTVGETLVFRTQVSGTGSTTVRAKVWKITAAEPTTWAVSGTDSTKRATGPWISGPVRLQRRHLQWGTSGRLRGRVDCSLICRAWFARRPGSHAQARADAGRATPTWRSRWRKLCPSCVSATHHGCSAVEPGLALAWDGSQTSLQNRAALFRTA
jgi:hypothetical protein